MITDEERQEVVRLHEKNIPKTHIANKTGVSRSKVLEICKEYDKTKNNPASVVQPATLPTGSPNIFNSTKNSIDQSKNNIESCIKTIEKCLGDPLLGDWTEKKINERGFYTENQVEDKIRTEKILSDTKTLLFRCKNCGEAVNDGIEIAKRSVENFKKYCGLIFICPNCGKRNTLVYH